MSEMRSESQAMICVLGVSAPKSGRRPTQFIAPGTDRSGFGGPSKSAARRS